VATPDETTGKETEFSLVGSLEINSIYQCNLKERDNFTVEKLHCQNDTGTFL